MDMKEKNHIGWYNLPEDYRNKLEITNDLFQKLRHEGAWGIQKEVDKYGGVSLGVIAVLRRYSTLCYDTIMPRLAEVIASKELRIAIFPCGMKMVDIVFYNPCNL